MSDAPDLASAALAYATAGVPIFPCDAASKRPLTAHGFKDASVDSATIAGWWRRWPDAMIGMPTGKRSGVWVLDIDDPALFTANCRAALPETRRVETGKGFHLHFAFDPSQPVANAQRNAKKGWPFADLPGAETRGEGGYVILPPSLHPSGRQYRWTGSDVPLPAPAALLDIVLRRHNPKPGTRTADGASEQHQPSSGDTSSGLAALEAECAAIRSAGDGAQEATLNEAALKIGGLVAGGALARGTARARLIAAGMAMASHNLRDRWTPDQVEAKIDRGLDDGACSPRSAEQRGFGGNARRSRDDPSPPPSGHLRPTIEVRPGELHIMATEAEDALIGAGAPFYVRGGLIRPVVDDLPASHGRRTKMARLAEIDVSTVIDHLSRSAGWCKYDGRRKALARTDPLKDVASTLLSRDGEWRFPRLAGVITTPTLRPDGTILSAPGYDARTQLLLLDPPPMPPIPDRPTRTDAMAALATLDGLLGEFPFVDGASRAVALSALITPVVRGALAMAPMHATTAPVAGSGKSYIIDLASAISVGQRASVISAGKTEEETGKRLDAAMLDGRPIVSIDNVNGDLGGDTLCQMVERPIVSVRQLGASKLLQVENRATCFATGNNIRLVGDMTRRVVLCSLDPGMERPELRNFRASPFDTVLADRGRYVAAALTIARAYIVADCPDQRHALASFKDWSRIVRSALVWLGRDDPVATMEAARADDPVIMSLRGLFAALHVAVGSRWRTAGQIKAEAETRTPNGDFARPDLHTALMEVAEDRRGGGIDAVRLGKFLGRYKGRVVGGLRLIVQDDGHSKQRVWTTEQV